MSKRTGVLELAVLGLLHEGPLHGYELRKRLNAMLGSMRAFSYGSLYPCLRELVQAGQIAEDTSEAGPAATTTASTLTGRRSKIVYRLTADGKERFQELFDDAGPAALDDEGFGVRFAFFGRAAADARMRILEGRQRHLEDRRDGFRSSLSRTRERLDSYTLELQQHGLETVEREVRWLNELIASESATRAVPGHPGERGHLDQTDWNQPDREMKDVSR
ncbi:MAG: PadR family transcriptional regulator [Actinomycetes bacterium]